MSASILTMKASLCLVALSMLVHRPGVLGFSSVAPHLVSSTSGTTMPSPTTSFLSATTVDEDGQADKKPSEITQLRQLMVSTVVAAAFGTAAAVGGPMAHASEIGVEVEAPTLFTGETLEICTKRGPLGACLETTRRTVANDNDKSKKYFRDPSELVRAKEAAMRRSVNENEDGNVLIEKLLKQSEDNREKNDLYVQRKTFENDQSATFGPFDRQVLIMNTDGRTFTLLENPQAMRLKKAGFIQGRQFVKQPTQQEIDDALEAENGGLAGAIMGIFSGGQ